MSIDNLKQRIPDYAKDLRLNLSGLITSNEALTPRQLYGSLLAAAIASRNAEVIAAISAEVAPHLEETELTAAKAAAAIMGMNNIYYRFIHLASNKEYGSLPARLRMNVIMNPGVDKADFELWSLVVSIVNGCGMCIDAHEKELLAKGLDKPAIQHAARIAAVVHAVAATLDAEDAMAPTSA